MKMMTVGRIKAEFSRVLEEVNKGETIGIEYGRQHKPRAQIVPFPQSRSAKRPLGLLKKKGAFSFIGDGKVTEGEFLNG